MLLVCLLPKKNNKQINKTNNNKEKALKVITAKTNEEGSNYVFKEIDSNNNYIFYEKNDKYKLYIVNIKQDTYQIYYEKVEEAQAKTN